MGKQSQPIFITQTFELFYYAVGAIGALASTPIVIANSRTALETSALDSTISPVFSNCCRLEVQLCQTCLIFTTAQFPG